jgi:hypothetical protein
MLVHQTPLPKISMRIFDRTRLTNITCLTVGLFPFPALAESNKGYPGLYLMTASRQRRRAFAVLGALLCWSAVAVGQTRNLSVAQQDAALSAFLDCRWALEERGLDNQHIEGQKLLQKYQAKRPDGHAHDGKYKGPLRAFGVTFDEVFFGAWGGVFVHGAGRRADMPKLLQVLRARGIDLQQGSSQLELAPKVAGVYAYKHSDNDNVVEMIVAPVRTTPDLKPAGEGWTYLCVTRPLNTDEVASKGLSTVREVYQVVEAQEVRPAQWVDAVIASKSPQRLKTISRYAHLNEAQIEALLAADVEAVVYGIVSAGRVSFSAKQIDRLLSKGWSEPLLLHRLSQLSPAQRKKAWDKADEQTRRTVTLLEGGSRADDLLMKIIGRGTSQEILNALKNHKPNTDHVDRLLRHPSNEVRNGFVRNVDFKLRPAQIERILQDSDPYVRIGILRHEQAVLTTAQLHALFDAGIRHHDPDVAFSYLTNPRFAPTAEQVEWALTQPNPRRRGAWVLSDSFTMTPAQFERGLADPDESVRVRYWGRKEITLSDEQLDRCTHDREFTVRDNCVQRPEFKLTQKRFERIVQDNNPNVPARMMERAKSNVTDLQPFIDEAFRNGDPKVLVALVSVRDLPLQERHAQLGYQSDSLPVRHAFCRRYSAYPERCNFGP